MNLDPSFSDADRSEFPASPLVTTRQAANMLDISQATVRRMIYRKPPELVGKRRGRVLKVTRASVEAYDRRPVRPRCRVKSAGVPKHAADIDVARREVMREGWR